MKADEKIIRQTLTKALEIQGDVVLDVIHTVIKQHTPMSMEAAIITTQITTAVEKVVDSCDVEGL